MAAGKGSNRSSKPRARPRRTVQKAPTSGAAPVRSESMVDLRRAIDRIDIGLVDLLNQRARHALSLGRIKLAGSLAIYQPDREDQVLANVQRSNGGPLENTALRRLFERIIDESRRIERLASPDRDERQRGDRVDFGRFDGDND